MLKEFGEFIRYNRNDSGDIISEIYICEYCDGIGYQEIPFGEDDSNQETCPICNGTGETEIDK